MQIFIDNRSGQPIYDQIYSRIKAEILSGAIAEDTMLPSIRALAKDLHVSVITTKRAYDELEREGFLYTVAGKGCFVAPRNAALVREEHLRRIEELLAEASRLAAACGLGREELAEMMKLMTEEEP